MITIITPLWRNNQQWTAEFIYNLQQQKLTYPIIFAESKPAVFNKSIALGLNYTYLNDFNDIDIYDFNYKLIKTIEHVTTPYTVIVDNDDQIYAKNFDIHAQFLNDNKDFVASRGSVMHIENEKMQLCYDKESILGNNATIRFQNGIKNYHSHFHDIVRTNILKFTHELIHITKINDMRSIIRLNSLIPCILGNINRNNKQLYYMHTVHCGTIATNTNILPPIGEWIKKSEWLYSISNIVYILAILLSIKDNLFLEESKQLVCTQLSKLDNITIPNNLLTDNVKTIEEFIREKLNYNTS